MKRIGIISDTHGVFDDKIRQRLADVDEIWHAGDFVSYDSLKAFERFKPLKAVYGNCDGESLRRELLEWQVFECEGLKVAMLHRGGTAGQYSPSARALIHSVAPQILVAGHTHHLEMEDDKIYDLRFINPGEAGLQARQAFRSVVILDLDQGRIVKEEVRKWSRK